MTVSTAGRERVRRRAEAQMTSTVLIKRGELGTLDLDTGLVGGIMNAETIYSGPARIKTITGQGTIITGAAEIDTRQVVISIPWDSTPVPARDDLVIVGDDVSADPDLPEQAYRVMEVGGGTLFGHARQLQCTGWHPSRYWGEQ